MAFSNRRNLAEWGRIARMAYRSSRCNDIAQKPRAAMAANPNMKTGLVVNQARSKTATSSQISTTAIPVRAAMSLDLLFIL